MKVIHITTIDTGGAYMGALRLHESMRSCGISSEILVRSKLHVNSPVIEINSNFCKTILSKGKNALNLLYKKGEIHGDRFGTDVSRTKCVKNADVIILHWINSFLSLSEIVKLCKLDKPVIWILHDMWLFTGGCHYDRYCGRYKQYSGSCPVLKSDESQDITHRNYMQKIMNLQNVEMTIVGPSQWIVDCAASSHITGDRRLIHIPNTLDIKQYTPLSDKENLRKKYSIPLYKKVILFGAADGGTENPMKGFSYLVEAIKKLSPKKYALAVFGNAGASLSGLQGYDTFKLGYITEVNLLREIYNMADVFVNPSLQEAFGFTVCEAMACGIPAVTFEVGGNMEQIRHRESGYLAKYQDANDLAKGIAYCAYYTTELGERAYLSAQRYSYENIGKQYKNLLSRLCRKEMQRG